MFVNARSRICKQRHSIKYKQINDKILQKNNVSIFCSKYCNEYSSKRNRNRRFSLSLLWTLLLFPAHVEYSLRTHARKRRETASKSETTFMVSHKQNIIIYFDQSCSKKAYSIEIACVTFNTSGN